MSERDLSMFPGNRQSSAGGLAVSSEEKAEDWAARLATGYATFFGGAFLLSILLGTLKHDVVLLGHIVLWPASLTGILVYVVWESFLPSPFGGGLADRPSEWLALVVIDTLAVALGTRCVQMASRPALRYWFRKRRG